MYKKVCNFVTKLFWAIFNLKAPRPIVYGNEHSRCDGGDKSKILVVIIDYNKIKDRCEKKIGRTVYPCGRRGLDEIIRYCRDKDIDYIDIMTFDEDVVQSTPLIPNRSYGIKNGGTDIAALYSLREILAKYDNILIANSSMNCNDAPMIEKILNYIQGSPVGDHFVIGCNGNSYISPRLPLSFPRTPHVVSNFFASTSIDIMNTLGQAMRVPMANLMGGYSNKYFAIRYFEVLLSSNVLCNNGSLVLFQGDRINAYRLGYGRWPRSDTRLRSK